MDILPSHEEQPHEEQRLLFHHDPQRAAHLAAIHSAGPDKFGHAARAIEVDLDVAVTEDVDMRGPVIFDEDDDAHAVGTK